MLFYMKYIGVMKTDMFQSKMFVSVWTDVIGWMDT